MLGRRDGGVCPSGSGDVSREGLVLASEVWSDPKEVKQMLSFLHHHVKLLVLTVGLET